MLLTGENRSTWNETCPSSIVLITNPTWTGVEFHRGLHIEGPEVWHYCLHSNVDIFLYHISL